MNTKAVRIVQVGVLAAVSLFASLVCVGNLLDYDSNYQFVKHVLAMDTIFEDSALMWRAVTNELLVTLAYWSIIVGEGVVAVLGWTGSCRLIGNMSGRADVFDQAKGVGFYAFLLALVLWFVGFVVIGSEWFAMWQSSVWNGKQAAMDIVAAVGIFMIIYMLPVQNLAVRKNI